MQLIAQKTTPLAVISFSLQVILLTTIAGAQQPPTGQVAPAAEEPAPAAPTAGEQPPPVSETAPSEPPPPASAPTGADANCYPPCRSGFSCVSGKCVSSCNPPCFAGEQCNENGECVAVAKPSAPPPTMVPTEPAYKEPPKPEGYEQHDGFMLRLTLGFGGGGAATSLAEDDIEIEQSFSGGGGSFSIDIGGSLTDNLVLHFRLSDIVIFNPTMSVETDILEIEDEEIEDATLTAVFFGPAISYYFMPINIYLTMAIGASRLALNIEDDDDDTRGTDYGLGLNLDFGKEWWVGANWGLGVAGRFWYTYATESLSDSESVPDFIIEFDEEFDWHFMGFVVLFSATYQ